MFFHLMFSFVFILIFPLCNFFSFSTFSFALIFLIFSFVFLFSCTKYLLYFYLLFFITFSFVYFSFEFFLLNFFFCIYLILSLVIFSFVFFSLVFLYKLLQVIYLNSPYFLQFHLLIYLHHIFPMFLYSIFQVLSQHL